MWTIQSFLIYFDSGFRVCPFSKMESMFIKMHGKRTNTMHICTLIMCKTHTVNMAIKHGSFIKKMKYDLKENTFSY